MKKPKPAKTPPKSSIKNGTGPRPLPERLSAAAVQAVLEDAVMEATADIAALSATLEERTASPQPGPDLVIGAIVPETPEEQALLELVSVPLLGPARIRALAEMGILTLDDLHTASPEQIAGVKGLGANNAKRIKEWVAQQPRAVPPAPLPPAPLPPAPLPPAPLPPAPVIMLSSGPDPTIGDANQAIFDALGDLDSATTRLSERLGPPAQAKRLRRQLEKIETVASELAEGPDVLPMDSLRLAIDLLDRIVNLLERAVMEKKLTEKRQETLCDDLRSLRRSLQKALGE